jgi:hypothetical protein
MHQLPVHGKRYVTSNIFASINQYQGAKCIARETLKYLPKREFLPIL